MCAHAHIVCTVASIAWQIVKHRAHYVVECGVRRSTTALKWWSRCAPRSGSLSRLPAVCVSVWLAWIDLAVFELRAHTHTLTHKLGRFAKCTRSFHVQRVSCNAFDSNLRAAQAPNACAMFIIRHFVYVRPTCNNTHTLEQTQTRALRLVATKPARVEPKMCAHTLRTCSVCPLVTAYNYVDITIIICT